MHNDSLSVRDLEHGPNTGWIGSAPTALQIAAFLVVGTVPLVFTGIQPVLLRALVGEGRLTAAAIGHVAAVEFLAIGIGVALAGALFKTDRLRLKAAIAALLLLAIDLVATRLAGNAVIADRAAAGLVEGTLVWQAASLIARATAPARWTGIYSISQSLAQFAAAIAVPLFFMHSRGANGGFLGLAITAVIALIASLALPERLEELPHSGAHGEPAHRGAAFWSLTSVFFALAFFVGFFAYYGQLSHQAGLTPDQADTTSALIVGIGIIGNTIAALLARRISYLISTIFSVPLLLFVLSVFLKTPSVSIYITAALVFGLLWGFFTPFLVPLVIEADPSRRSATFIPGVQCLGASAGPLLGSLFVSDTDVRGGVIVGAACIFVSVAIGVGISLVVRMKRSLTH